MAVAASSKLVAVTWFLQRDRKYKPWLHTIKTPESYCLDVHLLSIRDKL